MKHFTGNKIININKYIQNIIYEQFFKKNQQSHKRKMSRLLLCNGVIFSAEKEILA